MRMTEALSVEYTGCEAADWANDRDWADLVAECIGVELPAQFYERFWAALDTAKPNGDGDYRVARLIRAWNHAEEEAA